MGLEQRSKEQLTIAIENARLALEKFSALFPFNPTTLVKAGQEDYKPEAVSYLQQFVPVLNSVNTAYDGLHNIPALHEKYLQLVESKVEFDKKRLGRFFDEKYQREQYTWLASDRQVSTLQKEGWADNEWLTNAAIVDRISKIRTIINTMIPSVLSSQE